MYYYELIYRSQAYRDVVKAYEAADRWSQEGIKQTISTFLQTSDIEDNLCRCTSALVMKQPPESLAKHFKKDPDKPGYYRTKERSKLHKNWVKLCVYNNLQDASPWDTLWYDYGMNELPGYISMVYLSTRVLIASQNKIPSSIFSFLQQLTEIDYFQFRLTWAKLHDQS